MELLVGRVRVFRETIVAGMDKPIETGTGKQNGDIHRLVRNDTPSDLSRCVNVQNAETVRREYQRLSKKVSGTFLID